MPLSVVADLLNMADWRSFGIFDASHMWLYQSRQMGDYNLCYLVMIESYSLFSSTCNK